MNSIIRSTNSVLPLALLAGLLPSTPALAQYTPVYFDGFEVAASAPSINSDLGNPRQGGPLLPISNVSNTANNANDYHHQVFSAAASPTQPLVLASDAGNDPSDPNFALRTFSNGSVPIYVYPTMFSPNYNFDGTRPNGAIIGKRITFDLNVGAQFTPLGAGRSYLQAGITIGGSRPLIDHGDSRSFEIKRDATNPVEPNGTIPAWQPSSNYFGLSFVEDIYPNPSTTSSFVQSINGRDDGSQIPINFRSPHIGGLGALSVQIDVDDLTDGNPWDGVGSTTISVLVNGEPLNLSGSPEAPIFSYTRADGGYTDNFITLWGFANTPHLNVGSPNSLATHVFDNFTVYQYKTPTPVAGDYNQNGSVDAADYNVWRDNLGTAFVLPNRSPGETGNVNQADYNFWKNNFSPAPGASVAAAGAVPEPLSVTLAALMTLAAVAWRRADVL